MHRNRRGCLIRGLFIWMVLGARSSEAQFSANYQTNLISGVASNWSGDYLVGSNTLADVLLIQNSGVLSNGYGYLGYEVGSSNNSVVVSDTGSIWSNALWLAVGQSGGGNSLVVSNRGQVFSIGGIVGSGSSNNSVVICGTGSVWNAGNSQLRVGGFSTTGNSLVISNGGRAVNSSGGMSGDGNLLVVTGPGSVWSGGFSMIGGSINHLVVSAGGLVTGGGIGIIDGWSNTAVLVTGTGSVLSNTFDLYVGDYGWGNHLVISNGGRVFNNTGTIGFDTRSSNNLVLVTGTGSIWSNRNDLVVGAYGAGSRVIVDNGGSVFSVSGSVGNGMSGSNNSVVVNGTGSVWSNRGILQVGYWGCSNSLAISDGGKVFNGFGYLGYNPGSSQNTVVVRGSGSVWRTSVNLNVGYNGAESGLVVSNGGLVIDNGDVNVIGYGFSSSNNSVLVTDPGSVWTNAYDLWIGQSGNHNSLVISNGGRVIAFDANYVISSSNRVVVTGAGSTWISGSNAGNLKIGTSGSGNSVVVSKGGKVISTFGVIGESGGNNFVLVTDNSSVWSNSGALFMGSTASANLNSLVISNGGLMFNRDCTVGINSSNNSVRVVDNGVWKNRLLFAGGVGSSNSVVVAGGTVLASQVIVGAGGPDCDSVFELDSGTVTVGGVSGTGTLEVRYGKFILNGGVLQADTLVLMNACSLFVRNGGTLLFNHLVLDPNLSAVGDGIPNGWKQEHGLDPLDLNLAGEDADGDGMSNLQEFLAGTDPTSAASSFLITGVVRTGNDVLVSWTTGIGRTNALQVTSGAVDGSYATSNFADLFIVTNTVGTVTNYLDVGGATNHPARYYRVRLVP